MARLFPSSAPPSPPCSALPVVTDVARSLAFSPALHAMADRIFEAATAHGRLTLNGVHLRIERDARDWATIVGGQQMLWRGYIGTMRQLGFNSTTRLYVASGILSYSASGASPLSPSSCSSLQPSAQHSRCPQMPPVADSTAAGPPLHPSRCRFVPLRFPSPPLPAEEMALITDFLQRAGVCAEVHHKEQFIPQAELAGALRLLRHAVPSAVLCLLSCSLLPSGRLSSCELPSPPIPVPPAALNSEQKALVDFLVLARVHRFAGFGGSTFSFYLREHRALQVPAAALLLLCCRCMLRQYRLPLPLPAPHSAAASSRPGAEHAPRHIGPG